MATIMAESKAKAGIWTKHVDLASGRTFYFNMSHHRSYWELPDDVAAQVKTPAIETLREWDPQAAAKYDQPASAKEKEEEEERQRKRREELLQAAAAEGTAAAPATAGALHERMALAAQRRAEETKRLATDQQQKAKDGGEGGAAQNQQTDNAYIAMVRELQAKDRDTESSGGKWLVR